MIRITFLGTAAARPTVPRNVSATAIQREGDLWLLDCGEGTQRQMMRYATGFGIRGILITHLHGDHVLGLTGLARTLALQGRTDPLPVYGPRGSAATLESILHLGGRNQAFPIPIVELAPGEGIDEPEYRIEAFEVRHGTPAIGYALREAMRPGRFDVDRARALGVPEGPLFGRLHRGETVELPGGGTVSPEAVVGPPRPGRCVVFTGDTRPCREVADAAKGADLLVHDATFCEEEAARARETFHSTARDAARIANEAGVRRLILTHVSARYSAHAVPLEREASALFSATQVAYDGLSIELPYETETEPPASPAKGSAE
jgi:ribonuclease Z